MKYIILMILTISTLKAIPYYQDVRYITDSFFVSDRNDLLNQNIKKNDYNYIRNIMYLSDMFNYKNSYNLKLTYDKRKLDVFKNAYFYTPNERVWLNILYVKTNDSFYITTNKNKNINKIFISREELLNGINKKFKISIPFKKEWRVSSTFDLHRFHPVLKKERPHNGIDYAAWRGTPVLSVQSGIVIRCNRYGSYGNYVSIKHKYDYISEYAHLHRFKCKKGQIVHQGDVIGYVGNTGRSTGTHLHFGLKYNKNFINPLLYFKDTTKIEIIQYLKKEKKKSLKDRGLMLAIKKLTKKINNFRKNS